jgi:hypothetical protein
MIFALLLFGCADDGSQCAQLAAPTTHYEAKITCETDAEMALQSDVALRADFPMVEARCVPISSDPSLASSSGDPAENRAVATIRLATATMSGGLAQPRPR